MTTTDIIETLLDPDLDRNVVATTQPVGVESNLLSLALVHYTFENEEHIIMPRPHGNSKSQSAYVRTLPSTLRDVSQHVAPKHAVSEVSRSVGGLSHVSSVSQLPRNRQQSADC